MFWEETTISSLSLWVCSRDVLFFLYPGTSLEVREVLIEKFPLARLYHIHWPWEVLVEMFPQNNENDERKIDD